MSETSRPDAASLVRAVLDPVRLAVLAAAHEGPLSIEDLTNRTGATKRQIAEAIGYLATAGFLDDEHRLDIAVFHEIAAELPGDSPTDLTGPWTDEEARVLGRFFDGDRLKRIPSSAAKRRLVLERIAMRFEPGVRYHERDVNFSIQLIYADYAAVRRWLIDEGFMDRADGAYWRIGGRTTQPADAPEPRTLTTELPSVVCRTWELAMATDLVAAASAVSIHRYMSDRFAYPYTDDDAYDWISFASSQDPVLDFAVLSEGVVVGGVGSQAGVGERTGTYEIGWWLAPGHQGRGIGTAAASALIRYLFDELGAMELFAPVMAPNRASAALAIRLGMRHVGGRPSAYLKEGVRYDERIFSLTRAQWLA